MATVAERSSKPAGTDGKVAGAFPKEAVVDKGLTGLLDEFTGVPRFVSEFLIGNMVDPADPAPGMRKVEKLLEDHWIGDSEGELAKHKIREKGTWDFIGRIVVRFDQSKNKYFCTVGTLGTDRVCIDPAVMSEHAAAMLTGGCYGRITVVFAPTERIGRSLTPFRVTKFVPFQIVNIDLDAFVEARKRFILDEWIDLLVTTIGFDPAGLSAEEKLLHIARLLPLVEGRCHLAEFGICQSGKTHAYRAISNHSHVVTGSAISVASLFFNKLRRTPGAVLQNDSVAFDEISQPELRVDPEVVGMLKDMLNSGEFSRGSDSFSTSASVVLLGNIPSDTEKREVGGYRKHLFDILPQQLADDCAFIDRICGYIPGWRFGVVKPENLAKGPGLAADFFSEILHRLRKRSAKPMILARAELHGTHRDQSSMARIAGGMVKLLFPHQTEATIEESELRMCLDMGVDLRQRIVDQLAKIAPQEFGGRKVGYELKG